MPFYYVSHYFGGQVRLVSVILIVSTNNVATAGINNKASLHLRRMLLSAFLSRTLMTDETGC